MALFGGKIGEKSDGKKSEADTAALPNASQPAPSRAENPNASRGTQQGGVAVTNIGESIAINGDLTGNEDMVVEGSVEGSIDLPNNQLTIGANGTVKAEVNAKSVIVVGHVVGNIIGVERVEIQGSGRVDGTVTVPKLIVTEGAQLDGAVHMTGIEAAPSNPISPSSPSSPGSTGSSGSSNNPSSSNNPNSPNNPSSPRSTTSGVPAGEVRKVS